DVCLVQAEDSIRDRNVTAVQTCALPILNDVDANEAMLAERGVPGSAKVKEELKPQVSEAQEKIFEYVEWAEEHSTPMGAPDPAEAGEIIELLDNISEEIMYGQISAEEAAEKFRTDAESIFEN